MKAVLPDRRRKPTPSAMRAIVTSTGIFAFGSRPYRAALGRSGITASKREGDGATPVAILPLRRVFYRPDRVAPPIAVVPVQPISPDDGWCDEPSHPAYNQLTRLPIAASAEALWRDDNVYDVIGILGWNDDPIMPGRGSAIFLHLARADYAPTDGCIALSLPDLLRVLADGLSEILVISAPA